MSLRSNFLYNLIGTLAGILFPLVTFPYSARILDVDGIGQFAFFSSIISYVGLLSNLGIPVYAVREVAKVRDDNVKMVNTAVEILLLHLLLTFFGYLMIAFICLTVPQVSEDVVLFLTISAGLLLSVIGCDWFFVANEDFKYITIRGLVVRVICIVLLFTCVHSKSDLLLYAIISVIATAGNNLFNIFRFGQKISFRVIDWRNLKIWRHLYPSAKVFALFAVISVYTNLNAVILGFYQDHEAVGYYTSATKITSLVVGAIGALQTVMIPRFSYLAKADRMHEFNQLCQKVVDFVLMACIPSALLTAVLAPSLIRLFCGSSYEPAILTLIIVSPMIVFIAMSGIPCFQILYPLGHEKEAIRSVASGGIVNLLLCALLIPKWSYNGAAVAVLVCEAVVFVTMFLFGKEFIPVRKWSSHYLNCILAGFAMLLVMMSMTAAGLDDWTNVILIPIMGVSAYFLVILLMKDEFVLKLKIRG